MARLTPHFSANRAVRAYTVDYYLPAAAAYRARAAEHGTVGRQLVQWQHMLAQHWAVLRFGHVRVETQGDQYVFEVHVSLQAIDPQMVRVELYADGVNGSAPVRQEMTRVQPLTGAASSAVYRTQVPATRPATDYTARVIPDYPGSAVPLEAAHILWQR